MTRGLDAARFVLVFVFLAIVAAHCSRMHGSEHQARTESKEDRRLRSQILRCGTEPDEKAREACRDAVLLGLLETGMAFPDSQLFYERIGQTLVDMRKYDAAVNTYREGFLRYPENSRLYYGLARLLMDQYGAYAEAYGPLIEAVRWNPHFKEALALLGDVQRRLKRYDESTVSYQAALRVDPGYVEALVGLGRVFRAHGNAPDAVAPLSRAVQIAPTDGFAHEQLGGALLDSGRLEEAVESLQRATKLSYDPREAYCMLSAALARIGKYAESREACEFARKPRPSHRGDVICACR